MSASFNRDGLPLFFISFPPLVRRPVPPDACHEPLVTHLIGIQHLLLWRQRCMKLGITAESPVTEKDSGAPPLQLIVQFEGGAPRLKPVL
jgi:hypothetical protein